MRIFFSRGRKMGRLDNTEYMSNEDIVYKGTLWDHSLLMVLSKQDQLQVKLVFSQAVSMYEKVASFLREVDKFPISTAVLCIRLGPCLGFLSLGTLED